MGEEGTAAEKPWVRYRFKTRSIEDYRPIIFDPRFPWWCMGSGPDYHTIIAYLPKGEDLSKYWDDAEDIDSEEVEEIKFTSRLPKPHYFVESE